MHSTLLLASFLAIVPFVSADPTPVLAARQAMPSVCSSLFTWGSFSYKGCYTDSETNRVLTHPVTPNGPFTTEACIDACSGQSFGMAGVENGQSCYCDNQAGGGGLNKVDPTNCQETCTGNPIECCGGFNYFILYQNN